MAPAPVRQAAIEGLSKAPVPPFLPPYAALFSDPAGLLWVQLSPSGAKQVDLVAYSDDADEMHVAVYRLKR